MQNNFAKHIENLERELAWLLKHEKVNKQYSLYTINKMKYIQNLKQAWYGYKPFGQ